MIVSGIITVFIIFYFCVYVLYFIIVANSHVCGSNSNSRIRMGRIYKPLTGMLKYFINDKHFKDRIVNVPKMCISEFEILFFSCFCLLL
jgi:hypothetical protein